MRHAAIDGRPRRGGHTARHDRDWMKAPPAIVAVAAERRATIVAMAGVRGRRLVAVPHAHGREALASGAMITAFVRHVLVREVLPRRVLVGERCVLRGQRGMIGVRAVGVRELQQANAQRARVQRKHGGDRTHQLRRESKCVDGSQGVASSMVARSDAGPGRRSRSRRDAISTAASTYSFADSDASELAPPGVCRKCSRGRIVVQRSSASRVCASPVASFSNR